LPEPSKLELAQTANWRFAHSAAISRQSHAARSSTVGKRLVEILKQINSRPCRSPSRFSSVFAGTSGALDECGFEQVRDFEKELYKYATRPSGPAEKIMEKKTSR